MGRRIRRRADGRAMTHDEHRARHEELHRALDELVADWAAHNRGVLPSTTSIMDLIIWSYEQTQDPVES